MLERYLIEHCSPTLAGLKTANLFSCTYSGEEELKEHLQIWNENFAQKGIELRILRKRRGTALVYVYRRNRLQRDLQDRRVRQFLYENGYGSVDVDEALCRLSERLTEAESFPHEIGVFLGYPLEDVCGFIRNAGQNCKCSGYWKVYYNEQEAVKTFAKFNKCRAVYSRLWKEGRSILQLAVAA